LAIAKSFNRKIDFIILTVVKLIVMEFEAPIQTEYFRFTEPAKVGNCSIYTKNSKIWIFTKVNSSNEAKARDIAIQRIEKVCLSWAIRFDESLLFDESGVRRKTIDSYPPNFVFVMSKIGENDKKFLVKYVNSLENADPYVKKAIVYFERGLATKGSPNDSYFNFFKVLELISNKILNEECTKKKIDSNKKLATKEKIAHMCRVLDIDTDSPTVDNLVNVRNRDFDVSHAQVNTVRIKKEDLNNCMKLAKTVIMKYGHL